MEFHLRELPDLQSLDADVLRLNRGLEQASGISLLNDSVEDIRRDRKQRVQQLPDAITHHIQGRGGDIALRMFVPEKPQLVCLHLHDGAWSTGGADVQDFLLKPLSEHCNAAVVSVEYRQAPEAPYPAAPDDAESAALWLCEHARQRFGTDRLVIWGESAGAHLAVLSLLRLRARYATSPFAAAVLNYGNYDLTLTPSARNFGSRPLLINTPVIERFVALFLPAGIDRRDADISPLNAQLQGLPPALFSVGTRDPFLDDSTFMYSRWLCAGNTAELALYPGCPHGFTFFPIKAAERAFQHQIDFVRRITHTVGR